MSKFKFVEINLNESELYKDFEIRKQPNGQVITCQRTAPWQRLIRSLMR